MESLRAERDPVHVILPLGICSPSLDSPAPPHQPAQPLAGPCQGQKAFWRVYWQSASLPPLGGSSPSSVAWASQNLCILSIGKHFRDVRAVGDPIHSLTFLFFGPCISGPFKSHSCSGMVSSPFVTLVTLLWRWSLFSVTLLKCGAWNWTGRFGREQQRLRGNINIQGSRNSIWMNTT